MKKITILITTLFLQGFPILVAEADSSFQWALKNGGQAVCNQFGTNCQAGKPGADIGLEALPTNARDCSSILIAVIDSGVDSEHPLLKRHLVPGANFSGNAPDENTTDDHFHGTHVTGIIAAAAEAGQGPVGVCSRARILPVKVKGPKASILHWPAAYVDGIRYAIAQGARVVNISFAFAVANPEAKQLMASAPETLFVVSAGNGFMGRGIDLNLQNAYPASFRLANIIVVTATDNKDIRAGFANYGGDVVDLAAPGVNILSTMPTYLTAAMREEEMATGQGTLSGTSQAAPFVSAALALFWAQHPGARAAEIKRDFLLRVEKIKIPEERVRTNGRLSLRNLFGRAGLSEKNERKFR